MLTMNNSTRILMSGAAALAIAAAVYAVPALAAGNAAKAPGVPARSVPGYTNMMTGLSQQDFNTMTQLMSPLMTAMPAVHTQMIGDVATALHMSAQDLNDALAAGKSLSDIAAAQKVGIGEVRAAMTQSMNAVLDQLVANNTITRAQAGQMQGFMEQHLGYALITPMTGMGMMGGAFGNQR